MKLDTVCFAPAHNDPEQVSRKPAKCQTGFPHIKLLSPLPTARPDAKSLNSGFNTTIFPYTLIPTR